MKSLLRSLTFWVFVGAVAGYVVSSWVGSPGAPRAEQPAAILGVIVLIKTVFIKMLFMLVAPVVFFSLIDGLVGMGGHLALRRLGGLTFAYYVATTAIAIAIGLTAVLVLHPWTEQIPFGALGAGAASAGTPAATLAGATRVDPSTLIDASRGGPGAILKDLLLRCFQNPFAALAEMNILGIVTQAMLIGLAIVFVVPPDSPLVTLVRHITAVFHRILGWIILAAPVGVFAIVFDFNLQVGGAIFKPLFNFCLLVFGATMLHGLVVLPAAAWIFGGVPPWRLLRGLAQPMLVALSTSSSAATLPFTLKACEDDLGISSGVAGFVCPLGATVNMDGTALFEGVAAVFLAWLFGIELNAAGMVAIFIMAMVSSVGAPGMPSASMAGMQMVLLAAGIPLEAIGILLVVERPLDTFRTAVNVEGDIVGSVIVENLLRKFPPRGRR